MVERLNSQGEGSEAWRRLWHLYSYRREDFLAKYLLRENVESTFSAVKRLFGGSVRARMVPAMLNEGTLQMPRLQPDGARSLVSRSRYRGELLGQREGGGTMSAATSIAPVASGDFTAKEILHVRAALNFLHRRCGTWAPLGRALRFNQTSLGNIANGHRTVTAKLVVRIAKFVKVGVDDVLSGRFPAPGTCPLCGGHRSEEQKAEAPGMR